MVLDMDESYRSAEIQREYWGSPLGATDAKTAGSHPFVLLIILIVPPSDSLCCVFHVPEGWVSYAAYGTHLFGIR